MKNIIGVFLLILCFAFPVLAQEPSNTGWQIIAEESRLEFEGTQMGAPFKGSFGNFGGKIDFDPANLASSRADITIQMDSVDATSTDRNKYLRMADWLNVTKFPDAHFVTTGFEKGLDTNQYVARGNLTIRDTTLPVVLPFTLDITTTDSGETIAKMSGETTLNRLDFGVGQGQWQDVKTVANQVRLRVTLVAKPLVAHNPL
ncbi:MAG: YceI family protein [Micavibrio sp.]